MKVTKTNKPKSKTEIRFAVRETAKNVKDFEGEKNETAIRYEGDRSLIYCGIGNKKEVTLKKIRNAAANGIRAALSLKRNSCVLNTSELEGLIDKGPQAALEGALLGTYSFTKYQSEKKTTLSTIECLSSSLGKSDIDRIKILSECTFYARDLVNDNAGFVTPAMLASSARSLAKKGSLSVSVLTDSEIIKKKLGLIQAVGQGAKFPPRLIIINYTGAKKSAKTTAVIGKGITFDSGGQNLKPSGHIETMKSDMAGAASVLGIMKAASILKPKVNIIGVVPAAMNAVGSNSFIPGDIYRSYSGKTVEITNTDAEGRLVLADAFSYVQKNFKTDEIIDMATLTGSIVIALGDLFSGLFSNNERLSEKLTAAGKNTGEELWRMPVCEQHREWMKGDISDLRNTSKGKKRHAGSSTAAAFLQSFVENNRPWAHLDIAGTAFNEGDNMGEIPRFATGVGVRLVYEYLTS